MNKNIKSAQRAQSVVEYALLMVLVALVAIPLVALFGGGLTNAFQGIFNGEPAATQVVATQAATEAPIETPVPLTRINTIAQDFMARIMDYYNKNGKWPGDQGANAYSDLGLINSDWNRAVEGVYWDPKGSTIQLANKKKDDIQLYVNDLNGAQMKVYDGWSVICVPTTGSCYLHTVAPGNEVDINTLVAKQGE